MLVGDSVAESMVAGLKPEAEARLPVLGVAVPGCGLSSDVGDHWNGEAWQDRQRCLPAWRQRWPQQLRSSTPTSS
jgi:hypothetical protein